MSSEIPIHQVASVLKFNVGNEATGIKMDEAVAQLNKAMKAHPGFSGTTRYVCKSEWAYELSFVFDSLDSFKAWKTPNAVQEGVHEIYLKALKDCGIDEASVYAGARVHDKIA